MKSQDKTRKKKLTWIYSSFKVITRSIVSKQVIFHYTHFETMSGNYIFPIMATAFKTIVI